MNEPAEYKYDVFVSYAEADRAWVKGYLLPALGLPPERIITPRDFRPGASVVAEFERAITGSRYVALVLSPTYLNDQWSNFSEQLISYAGVAEQRDRLIPLLLQPCTLPLRIDFRIRLDCTEESNWDGEIARLRDLLAQSEPTLEDIPCPYPGMAPFRADTRFFYGRAKEIDALLRRLRHQNFLFVIGPSGSGKSSLVFAGLIADLHKRQRGQWQVKSLRLGNVPMQALADALGDSSARNPLPADEYGELVSATLAQNPPARRLLIIIDQFEELFAQTDKPQQTTFIAALKALRQVETCALVLTMRADFYPDLMNSDLWPVDSSERLEIAPLRGEALREAIAKPAEEVGVYIEDRLLERLLVDAADEPGVLPLVQETMVLLWEKRARRLLPFNVYEQLGGEERSGLAVAMATAADAAINRLSPGQQAIARRIFLRLMQFGEGRADTRRQQPVAELRSVSDDPRLFDQILRHLADNRLLTLSGEETGADKKVDIAHEALISGWPKLRQWVTKRRAAEQTRRWIEEQAQKWKERRGRDESGGLLDEVELLEAERWQASPDAADLGYDETLLALIQASRERLTLEKENLRKLYEEAEQRREEAERQRATAERQRQMALARQLAAQAELTRNQQANLLERSVLLAVEAMRRLPSLETEQPLRRGLALLPRPIACMTHEHEVEDLTFSPDGHYLATRSMDGIAQVWEVATSGEVSHVTRGGPINDAIFSPDGRYLATVSNNTARVWEATSGQETVRMTHDGPVGTVTFSPDGCYLATISNATARVWKVASGEPVANMTHDGPVGAVAFGPDGRYVATASEDESAGVWEWEAASGQEVVRMNHDGPVRAVAFSQSGRYLATASEDKTARVWNITCGREVARMIHEREVAGVAFSPDGRRLATACWDGTARVWLVWPEDLITEACARLTRNLTLGEWRQYLGDDEPYRKTCSNLPPGDGVPQKEQAAAQDH